MIKSLLFVIFGWPEKFKDLGAAMPGYCPHCDNDAWLSLIKRRRWLSLFFIPVIPLGRADHYLTCSICGAAVELRGKEPKNLQQCVRATEALETGRITEQEYQARLDAALPAQPPEARWQPSSEENQPLNAQFCYQCGAEIAPGAAECKACGWDGAIRGDVSPPPVERDE